MARNLTLSISSWEFFTTLDYEWSIIRGHRPYRWTIWVRNHTSTSFGSRFQRQGFQLICLFLCQIYSLTRVATLMVVILSFIAHDYTMPRDCQVCPDCPASTLPYRQTEW